jgi:hypothetical protein
MAERPLALTACPVDTAISISSLGLDIQLANGRASINRVSSCFVSLLMCGSRRAAAIALLLSGKKYVDGNGGSCALAAPAKTIPKTAAALDEMAW